ncbi:uncharacterized protein LOC106083616 isoform X1 [Stomoxys calcitrans]|uniref:uncharacterized protein LOC106083616 isoform X1 n=1 Tax=Stomoxys calcitrans TaxID=35570 RepID=UPI0027E32D2C|nr:uncharacterized protein LOC106083616 isoform X1 [Stomoxys calcitrans]
MFIKSNVFLIAGVLCGVLLTVCEAKKEHQKQQQQQQQQQEVWEQDLSDTFKIEGSDQGIQKVNLKCGSDSMHVVLETEKPFTGVMYTRGSFYKQTAPCFVKPSANEGGKSLEMNFSLDECQTTKDGELYSNIVVIQNDPELITPGDSAFSLECDFRQPRNINVEASMQARDRIAYASKITLTSPDPSEVSDNTLHPTVTSETNTVTYIPKDKLKTKPKKQIVIEEEHTIHLGTVEDVTHTYTKEEL